MPCKKLKRKQSQSVVRDDFVYTVKVGSYHKENTLLGIQYMTKPSQTSSKKLHLGLFWNYYKHQVFLIIRGLRVG